MASTVDVAQVPPSPVGVVIVRLRIVTSVSVAVIVYPVINTPYWSNPLTRPGGVNVTDAVRGAATRAAETFVGASGTAPIATELEAAEAGPVPALFVAVTTKEYRWPLIRFATVMGLEPPLAVRKLGSAPSMAVTV